MNWVLQKKVLKDKVLFTVLVWSICTITFGTQNFWTTAKGLLG